MTPWSQTICTCGHRLAEHKKPGACDTCADCDGYVFDEAATRLRHPEQLELCA